MRIMPLNANDGQILDVVREWVELLAAERYARAVEFVDPGQVWTPALLRSVIRNYGSVEPRKDGSTFRVTSIGDAKGGPSPRHAVDRQGGRISVWFDLPLNGQWSDLTATFQVSETKGGLALVLDDVHVM
jgi:hypothetical protein